MRLLRAFGLISTLALASLAAAGCAADGMAPGPEDGKADDLRGEREGGATDVVAFRVQPMAELDDPGCEDCDAVGFARASIEMAAPVEGDVLIKAVVRHSSPEDLRGSFVLNSNHNFIDPVDDGSWMQDVTITPAADDGDAMIHSIARAADDGGCATTAEHTECFDVTFVAALGKLSMLGFEGGESAIWDFEILDLDLNGAKGELRELSVVVLDPSAAAAE